MLIINLMLSLHVIHILSEYRVQSTTEIVTSKLYKPSPTNALRPISSSISLRSDTTKKALTTSTMANFELLIVIVAALLPFALPRPSNRIVGGSTAYPGEFPYQVNVQTYDEELNVWTSICGGAILNSMTILTASHCSLAARSDDPRFRIVAGEWDITQPDGTEQFLEVEYFVLHHKFDEFTYDNDVGLMFLKKEDPLIMNKNNTFVESIRIPPANHIATGNGTVTGWGHEDDSFRGKTAKLNKLNIPIFKDSECQEIYPIEFTNSMMCAGNLKGGYDACAGDSGGPLVASDLDHKYVAGIVSWGIGCGQSGYLGVYTKVSRYTEWIKFVVNYLDRGSVDVASKNPSVNILSL